MTTQLRRSRLALAVCLCMGGWSASASGAVTGTFDGAAPSFFVAPGGIAGTGPGALDTTVDTTAEPAPGQSSPYIPPIDGGGVRQVEVLFLTDTTGSMSTFGNGGLEILQNAIRTLADGGVRASGLLADIESSASTMFAPDPIAFSWAVAEYKDVIGSNSFPDGYAINTGFGSAAAATAAIDAYTDPPITDGGGLDLPEAQFRALTDLSQLWSVSTGSGGLGGSALGAAERIIIWTGDSEAHETTVDFTGSGGPIYTYPSLFETFSSLREQSIAVYGFNAGGAADGLNSGGGPFDAFPQADTIAAATGGIVTNSFTAGGSTTVAAQIEDAITGGFGFPGEGAIKEMNNITVRWDPADVGPWGISAFERTTGFPAFGYEFDFTYATLGPFGSNPGNLFGFPAVWGADGPMSFLDSWGMLLAAPVFADSRFVTFELRVDGVLLDTVEVFLTNETAIPEPAMLGILSLGALGLLRRRRPA